MGSICTTTGSARTARWAVAVALCATVCACRARQAPSGPAVPAPALAFPESGPDLAPLRTAPAFPALTFSLPVFATNAGDGTDRVFVVEQGGRILVFPNDPAATSATVFLDLSGVVQLGGEEGLLGLAFDPDYEQNGWFHVHYSAAGPRRSVIERYTVSANPDVADPTTAMVLLEVDQPYGNHNAGMLAFGTDGMLYIAMGDGGGGGDPMDNGQNLTTLLGSMLRVDPHGGVPYGIPGDNPFVASPTPGVRGEIWAYGLRNPWRFSFDRLTGDLWLGDVGQGAREEINLLVRGGNYGWPVFEGTLSFRNPFGQRAGEFAQPVFDYDRSQGQSITGGYVYRGAALPELHGHYIYGDFASGTVWALEHADGQLVRNREIARMQPLSSLGEDQSGELLLVDYNGSLHRLEPSGGSAGPFPTTLSATGLFADTTTLAPVDGLLEYEVQAPLWSDGARKRRWLAVTSERITFSPDEPWEFPRGTVLVKHFELELTPGDLGSTRRLETRVLVHETSGWAGYTYRWNESQTDADLIDGRENLSLTVAGEPRTYTLPSRGDCRRCHQGQPLGLHTAQVNRSGPIGPDQLGAWDDLRLFHGGVFASAGQPQWPEVGDATAPVGPRARAYLAANCANCHHPAGPTPTAMDLRYATERGSMGVVGVTPQLDDLGLPAPYLVDPGNKENSVLWQRLRRLDGTRMPPLGSHHVDEQAVDLVGAWIDTLR